eukprot:SAG11_NODE_858_length_6850_cov_11.886535_10_plen_145_part_00
MDGPHAGPLAQALDATLAQLMDEKIREFDHKFKGMKGRLDVQQDVLRRLRDRLQRGALLETEVDEEIKSTVASLESKMNHKLPREDFKNLEAQIEHMEAEIKVRLSQRLGFTSTLSDAKSLCFCLYKYPTGTNRGKGRGTRRHA